MEFRRVLFRSHWFAQDRRTRRRYYDTLSYHLPPAVCRHGWEVLEMRFVVAAGLMVVCAGGIGRLLWLLEGRPPLDRPAWWPARRSIDHATAGSPTSPSSADHDSVTSGRGPGGRLAAVGACAACCGIRSAEPT